jgi:Protein of unknown function, DUF547
MKINMASILFSLIFVCSGYPQTSDALFTTILHQYVKEGEVNYTDLCKDNRLSAYISDLSNVDPDSLSNDPERLAFWINAYNAYTLKVICEHFPVNSINDLHSGGLILGSVFKTTIWDQDFVVIHNKKITLNYIEHKIIRPVFRDPRAHFALVCASKSCPALRNEAYVGSLLDKQLDDQARIFLADPRKNRFNAELKSAKLSKILDWYGKDFGNNKQEILIFVSKFLPDSTARSIQKDTPKWSVDYLTYDWSLNGK